MASRKLEPLSDGGPQQAPVWSPDGTKVAFVRDNNIFLVKLLYNNSESQVTKDGRFNHIINGIPDWVNEEEFAFSHALTFNADGTMLCWLRYDESAVQQYRLIRSMPFIPVSMLINILRQVSEMPPSVPGALIFSLIVYSVCKYLWTATAICRVFFLPPIPIESLSIR